MSKKDEALKLALEALCCVKDMVGHPDNIDFIDRKIAALREALASEAKEQPAQRTWVGLTNEEIEARAINFYNPEMYKRAVLWAQEKLKERNQ